MSRSTTRALRPDEPIQAIRYRTTRGPRAAEEFALQLPAPRRIDRGAWTPTGASRSLHASAAGASGACSTACSTACCAGTC